ncbi:MAG: hypothetical protein HY300_17530, partial [Verrucomicrobia bacterium]|nr:hypothetical protein [Verrucomicrobiota bacterium]
AVLSASMSWTSNTALLNERNNQLSVGLFAAEAATEKVLTSMINDYRNGGESTVYNNLGVYRTNVPYLLENLYWTNFVFSDAAGGANRTYVSRLATQTYTNLIGQYVGLSGFASTYRIISNARQTNGRFDLTNAVQQDVQLASIPVFQFAIFYNSLMEFTWAAPLTVRGRVHANNDIYTGSSQPLIFTDAVTATSTIQKTAWAGYSLSAMTGSINYQSTKTTNASSLTLPIGTNNTPAAVHEVINMPPTGEDMNSAMGQQRYYNKAEMLLVVSNSSVTVNVKTPFDVLPTPIPWSQCTNFVSTNKTFTDQREGKTIQTTEIDVGKFTTWAATNVLVISKLGAGSPPNVLYVADNRTTTSTKINGVRLVNGQTLPSRGLTVATPNPLYTLGHLNCPSSYLGTTNTSLSKPASLVSDALTILSPAWSDSASSSSFTSRPANDTTVNAAIITGVVYSAGSNGSSPFSGGVMNLPRLLEDWGNGARTLTLNGSMINLYNSMQATGPWQTPGIYYYAPSRNFNFDTNFLDPVKQPPGTPAVRALIRGNWYNPMANVTNYSG